LPPPCGCVKTPTKVLKRRAKYTGWRGRGGTKEGPLGRVPVSFSQGGADLGE